MRSLAELEAREPHALVKHAIIAGAGGLRDARRPPQRYPLSRYMWLHERDAVRWVEQGKAEVAQLAGDVVLLGDMTYRLRRSDPAKADEVAALADLPRCVAGGLPADRERDHDGMQASTRVCAMTTATSPRSAATRAAVLGELLQGASPTRRTARRPGGGGASPCTARDGGWWSSGDLQAEIARGRASGFE